MSIIVPNDPEKAFLLASSLVEMGDPQALTALANLLKHHPKHARGWSELGVLFKNNLEHEASLGAFERAIEADPSLVKAHFIRANVLHTLYRFEEAKQGYKRALEISPNAKEICLNLGLTLVKLDAKIEAREAFERVVALDPTFSEAWFNLGLAHQDLHDLSNAVMAYRSALEHRPDYAEAAVNLGIALQETGAMDEAIAVYRQAVSLEPKTFYRITQAITAASTGRLWLNLGDLRRLLVA